MKKQDFMQRAKHIVDIATEENSEIDNGRAKFLEVIANSKEPFASEFRAILEKYPYPCDERAALVTDVMGRSYAKL